MLTALRVAAWFEATSLLLLVTNLATVHEAALASVVGPLHGAAYLTVITTSWLAPATAGAHRRSLIPGIGGLLTLRATGTHRPDAAEAE